jgi:hypothetical protein
MKRCIAFIKWIINEVRGEKKRRAQIILEFCEKRKEKTQGFCGIPYSQEDDQLYLDLKSSTTTRQTCNA